MAESELLKSKIHNHSGKLIMLIKMELLLFVLVTTQNSCHQEELKVKSEYGKLDQEN
jgi:hypothetical protein